jgi:hypothetical protein
MAQAIRKDKGSFSHAMPIVPRIGLRPMADNQSRCEKFPRKRES